MAKRTLALGDIHGCHVALETLLTKLALSTGDTLVVLGDIVDRGPGSRQAIELLMAVRESSGLIMILGNHEEMMLDALSPQPASAAQPGDDLSGHDMAIDDLASDDLPGDESSSREPVRGRWYGAWRGFGGDETLDSYGGDPDAVPPEHLAFLRSGRDYWESGANVFIHANLEPGIALPHQSPEWLRWTHLTGWEEPLSTGQRVICGHTPHRSGKPGLRPGWVCIDTLAFADGWLTALDVETGEIFQATQSGRYRTGWI